jgi:hypothetical protein
MSDGIRGIAVDAAVDVSADVLTNSGSSEQSKMKQGTHGQRHCATLSLVGQVLRCTCIA